MKTQKVGWLCEALLLLSYSLLFLWLLLSCLADWLASLLLCWWRCSFCVVWRLDFWFFLGFCFFFFGLPVCPFVLYHCIKGTLPHRTRNVLLQDIYNNPCRPPQMKWVAKCAVFILFLLVDGCWQRIFNRACNISSKDLFQGSFVMDFCVVAFFSFHKKAERNQKWVCNNNNNKIWCGSRSHKENNKHRQQQQQQRLTRLKQPFRDFNLPVFG